jgi:hypothetical protein
MKSWKPVSGGTQPVSTPSDLRADLDQAKKH